MSDRYPKLIVIPLLTLLTIGAGCATSPSEVPSSVTIGGDGAPADDADAAREASVDAEIDVGLVDGRDAADAAGEASIDAAIDVGPLDGGCACVPPNAEAGEQRIPLECACATGLCENVPRGTGDDCLMVAPGVMSEYASYYDECGIVVIERSALDSPGYQWTLDSKTRMVVGVRYAPWAYQGAFWVDRQLYCPPDVDSAPLFLAVPPVVAGRNADGCALSRMETICPRDAGGSN